MNIAIFSGTFAPQINGVVSYVTDTAAALVKQGHAVHVYVPKPKRLMDVNPDHYPFKLYFVPSLPGMIYPEMRITQPSLLRLAQRLREQRIEVIHLNDPSPLSWEGMMVAKLLKIPVVMTFHTFYFDADILKAVRFGRVFGLFKSPLERLNAYFHNFADVVICPSLSAQQELTREGLTTPSVIINNSIDASSVRRFTKKEKVARRRELNLPAQGPVGIFTGRMAADKRVDVLLQCWAKVCARYPSAHLVLIGNGPEEAKLRQLAQTLRLKTNVLFLGKMTRAAIFEAGWYAVADVFVSASRIENQSMSMIEAMVSGLPIIAVNMRGVAELVDSRNGIVTTRSSAAALARAVLYALDNPKERERLAEGSLVRAQQHTTPVTVSQLEALYHRLIHVATHTI